MESKRLSKSQHLCEDIISTLPSSIIETILCLVPIKDAVRTSILSRNWEYNWTKIPNLVFIDKDMFDRSTTDQKLSIHERNLFYAINQILLLHQSPILEFTLSIYERNNRITRVEIDQIIAYLSRHNTLKKLSLSFPNFFEGYELFIPLSIFSLYQLTELSLIGCFFQFKPTFIGFGNLTSLHLDNVPFSTKALLLLVSSCPLLKRFTLISYYYNFRKDDDVTIIDIFKCLPMIEHLTISPDTTQSFYKVGFPRDHPIALVHLKYLTITYTTFTEGFNLSFLDLMIRSSPNLEKIKLKIYDPDTDEEISFTVGDYSDIWFEHLIELEIDDFTCREPHLEFVKLILVKSPVLKKVSLMFDGRVTNDKELEMLTILLRSPRASPVAEIVVERKKHW